MWFDSHTHFDRFVEQDRLDALLEKAMDAKVSQMLAVGGSEAANTLSCNLANKFPDMIYASAGYDRDLIDSSYNLIKTFFTASLEPLSIVNLFLFQSADEPSLFV